MAVNTLISITNSLIEHTFKLFYLCRRIRKLQDEIRDVQASTLAAEEEYTRLAYTDYKSQQEASQINKQIDQETMTCRELEAAIRETIQYHQSKK